MAEKQSTITDSIKKDISRLRSEVRKLQDTTKATKKDISAYSGMSTGEYWTATGMPWIGKDGRKAVLTEYFWQPIRGQPRRVDTNELRQFSQDFWVSACVKILMDEIASLDWDIVPKEEFKFDWVSDKIKEVKEFLKVPNKNNEPFSHLIKALLKDILEIDAGVIVKVFDINSYDFDNIEPKSGAPILKPKGQRNMTELYVRDGASFLKEIDKFGFEQGYWQYSYQIPAHPMWFNRDEIVYVSEHNRSMSCYGYARTQSILDIVKSLHYSTLYNKRFFEETPIPDGAISLMDTNEVEMKDFMNYWNNEFKAQPHKVAILNKDLKWQPFAVSQRELEFLDTQKWYFNIVISAFGLTPSELGITDDLNRATSATQAELVKRKGIRPFLKMLESYINEGILTEWDYEGIEFQFIYDDPAEKSARLENWNLELTMGVKTINEVRNEMGLEPIEGGDVSNNMSSMFGGNNGNSDPNNNDSNNTEENNSGESQGYSDNVKREESKNYEQKSLKSEQLYKGTEQNTLNHEQLKLGIEIEREHQDSLELTDEEVEQVARDHLKEDPEYYTHLRDMEERYAKGIDDGQYYREQPIAQPIRPSGAMFQPQNNTSRCPLCNCETLADISSLEELREDLRCTQCGARFNKQELEEAPMMAEMTNILMMNNSTRPIGKSFTKNDDHLDCKNYCGFDTSKSFPFAESYAASKGYFNLLTKLLKGITSNKIKSIIDILTKGLENNLNITEMTKQIDEVIKDYPRAQMIARTEVIRLANRGNIDRMKDKGTGLVKFIAAPEDGRLCKFCRKKDNKIYSIKTAPSLIPVHPRCRCTLTEYEEL